METVLHLPTATSTAAAFLRNRHNARAMAKVGEGDERWIVKERDDGKNCNGWHWSETNLSQWSKDRLTELLVGLVAMDEDSAKGWCKRTGLEKCTGDVRSTVFRKVLQM